MNCISNIIEKKAESQTLSDAEITQIVDALAENSINDVQLGAFLMAVRINNMTFDEIAAMTRAMLSYGYHLKWVKSWAFQVVDKHSTGGVGDKVSIILAPAVAACGGKVPMIASRALGFTSGTLDKLMAIPGFEPELSVYDMKEAIENIGVFIASQSDNISPVEKKLHDLRNASATVFSDPLTVASIMSKKIVEGLEGLVLDLKVGKAGLIRSKDHALKLAHSMIRLSRMAGIRAVAVLTRMDFPIGRTVGPALEMAEAFQGLNNQMCDDLRELVETLGGLMLWLAGLAPCPKEGELMIRDALASGRALNTFHLMLIKQGVKPDLAGKLCNPLPMHVNGYLQLMGCLANRCTWIEARRTGTITDMDTVLIAKAMSRLSCGHLPVGSNDPRVGCLLIYRVGARINEGESWMVVYHDDHHFSDEIYQSLRNAITIQDFIPELPRATAILQTLNIEFV